MQHCSFIKHLICEAFMKKRFLLISCIICVVLSCSKKTIKAGSDNPDLPAYSENGLNTGGILINNQPWLMLPLGLFTTSRPLQLFSYPAGDSVVVLLNGDYKDASLRNTNNKTIFIVLKNIKISSDEDLALLNNKTFTLDGVINYSGFSESYGYNKTGRGTGTLAFGKVSVISNITYGDGTPGNPILHPYIIAGKLDVNVNTGTSYSLTAGRFDVTVVRSSNQFVVF